MTIYEFLYSVSIITGLGKNYYFLTGNFRDTLAYIYQDHGLGVGFAAPRIRPDVPVCLHTGVGKTSLWPFRNSKHAAASLRLIGTAGLELLIRA